MKEACRALEDVFDRLNERIANVEEELETLKYMVIGVCPVCKSPLKKAEIKTPHGTFKCLKCTKCSYMSCVVVKE